MKSIGSFHSSFTSQNSYQHGVQGDLHERHQGDLQGGHQDWCHHDYLDMDDASYEQIEARDDNKIEKGNRYKIQYSRDVLFEFHLKFWNTASIVIPVRSLL